jgi:hypothetical protein
LRIFAVLAVATSGCRAREEPAPAPSARAPAPAEPVPIVGAEPRVYAMGELGAARDYTMSAESVKDCLLDSPFAAKSGFVKVGVEVELRGTSTAEVPANPFYATLRAGNGDEYPSTLAGCDPGLPSIRLTAGQKARGFVTFEIPKATARAELRYAPLVIGPGVEELRFAIAR